MFFSSIFDQICPFADRKCIADCMAFRVTEHGNYCALFSEDDTVYFNAGE